MIGRLIRHPIPYLVLLAGLSFQIVEKNGWLRPRITPDTQGYEHLLAVGTLTEALSGLRSYGYPLLIEVFDLARDGWAHLPRFHFAAWCLAVLVFWGAAARFTRSRWLAFAAAAPLFFLASVEHVELVVTDSISESLGLLSVAFLLLVVGARRRGAIAVHAALLGLTVFFTYFTRPNYQFLVVLVPLLGAVLRLCHRPREPLRALRCTVALAALTFGPWLAFCALRQATVGHFSVSTFSGYHLGSLGAMMLDDELVAELPRDLEPLAREILEERRRRGFEPMGLESDSSLYQNRQFGLTMFAIVEPITTRLVLEEEGLTMAADGTTELGPMDVPGMMGPTALKIDLRLVELGKAAIRARPLVYLKWVKDSVRMGLAKTRNDPLVPFLTALLAFSLVPLLVRAGLDPTLFERPWADRALGVFGLFLVAGTYFAGHTLLLALIHWPKDRYALAANLLLPSALAAALFELWRWIVPPAGSLRPRRGAKIAAAVWAALLCVGMAEVMFRIAGVDFDRQRRQIGRIPIFHRVPTVPTGPAFFRRPGPDRWSGRVLDEGEPIEAIYDPQGFRNPPDLADWEVVVTGDGFVEAGYLGREDLLTTVLESELGVAVKNLGLNHTGSLAQIHFVDAWGKAPGTRDAVLVFNEGDDLEDLRREGAALYWSERGIPPEPPTVVPQTSLVRAVLGPLAGLGRTRLTGPRPAPANAVLALPGSDPLRVNVFNRVPGPQDLSAETLAQLDDVVRRWAEVCRDLGLRPWLVHLPAKHRVLKPFLTYDEDVAAPLRDWSPTALPQLMASLAETHRVEFVNAWPRLARATRKGKETYHRLDPYLSAEGSRLLGNLLATRLAAAGEPARASRETSPEGE